LVQDHRYCSGSFIENNCSFDDVFLGLAPCRLVGAKTQEVFIIIDIIVTAVRTSEL
jgi:hypothetical protein